MNAPIANSNHASSRTHSIPVVGLSKVNLNRLSAKTHTPARLLEMLSKKESSRVRVEFETETYTATVYDPVFRWDGEIARHDDGSQIFTEREETRIRRTGTKIFFLDGNQIDPDACKFFEART